MTIPPVSFRRFGEDRRAFAAELGASFERYGFAVVTDAGLPAATVAAAEDAARRLFALPEAAKRRYVVPGASGQRGYTPFGVETAKGAAHHDLKEFWHVGRELAQGHPYAAVMPPNLWPEEVAGFRAATLALYDALEALGRDLLTAIALRLGLAEDGLADSVRDGNSVLRLLHYPPAAFDGPNVRAAAHEDINTITLLLGAEEAGLQILRPDGTWLDVAPPEGAVVCNVGDMLQRLTNGVLPSTTHRVVNPAPERRGLSRYSMPFFLHFRPDFTIRTLPGCVRADRPDRNPEPITAQAYLEERLREIKLAVA